MDFGVCCGEMFVCVCLVGLYFRIRWDAGPGVFWDLGDFAFWCWHGYA